MDFDIIPTDDYLEEVDAFIRELGYDPQDFTSDEKGAIYEAYKTSSKRSHGFFEAFLGPKYNDLLAEKMELAELYDCVKQLALLTVRDDIDNAYFSNMIHQFRSAQHSSLQEVNSILEAVQRRKSEPIMYSTNSDQVYTVGSRMWFQEKVLFEFCNELLDIVDPIPLP